MNSIFRAYNFSITTFQTKLFKIGEITDIFRYFRQHIQGFMRSRLRSDVADFHYVESRYFCGNADRVV